MSKGEVSELLKPRWKLINDFPGCNKEAMWYGESFAIHGKIYHSKDYPGILRPMAWYEEREASEMPEYVRGLGKVLKVISWQMDETGEELFFRFEGDDKKSFVKKDATLGYYAHDFLPATETEYNQYLKTKQ